MIKTLKKKVKILALFIMLFLVALSVVPFRSKALQTSQFESLTHSSFSWENVNNKYVGKLRFINFDTRYYIELSEDLEILYDILGYEVFYYNDNHNSYWELSSTRMYVNEVYVTGMDTDWTHIEIRLYQDNLIQHAYDIEDYYYVNNSEILTMGYLANEGLNDYSFYYQDGFRDGERSGYQQGLSEGYSEGYLEGELQGELNFINGSIYASTISDAEEQAIIDFQNSSEYQAILDGRYNTGVNDGILQSATEGNAILEFGGNIIGTVFSFLLFVFVEFEIMGINGLDVLLTLIGLAALLFVLKKVL